MKPILIFKNRVDYFLLEIWKTLRMVKYELKLLVVTQFFFGQTSSVKKIQQGIVDIFSASIQN